MVHTIYFCVDIWCSPMIHYPCRKGRPGGQPGRRYLENGMRGGLTALAVAVYETEFGWMGSDGVERCSDSPDEHDADE